MPYKDPKKHREYHNHYSKTKREKLNGYAKTFRLNHPDVIRENKRRMRNLKRNIIGQHTQGEWELLKKQYGYRCPVCEKEEPNIRLTEDHIIPISKGGSDYIENIQPLCKSCNCSKGNRTSVRFSVRPKLIRGYYST